MKPAPRAIPRVVTGTAWLIAAVFLLSAAAKLAEPIPVVKFVKQSLGISPSWGVLAAILIVDVGIATLLLVPSMRRLGLIVAMCALVAMLALLKWADHHGITSCGCFGTASTIRNQIIVDGALLAMAAVGWLACESMRSYRKELPHAISDD